MKVYVDELPEDCIDCPCESEYYCNLLYEDVGCLKWGEVHKNCPLQSLSDYTKQARKEVVQELKNKMLFCSERFADGSHYYNGKELDEIIDQIQGGTK